MKLFLDGLKLIAALALLILIPIGCLQINNISFLHQTMLSIIFDLLYIIIVLIIAMVAVVFNFKSKEEKGINDYNNLHAEAVNYVNEYNKLQNEATNLRDELIRVVEYAQNIEGEKQELSEKLKKANKIIELNKANNATLFPINQTSSTNLSLLNGLKRFNK